MMLAITGVDAIGYLASALVVLSLTMRSPKRTCCAVPINIRSLEID